MNKSYGFIELAGLLCFLAGGSVSGQTPDLPHWKPDVTSAIVHVGKAGPTPHAEAGLSLGHKKTSKWDFGVEWNLSVTSKTIFLERRASRLNRVSYKALRVGQKVQVWFWGGVSETEPPQADASVIVIL